MDKRPGMDVCWRIIDVNGARKYLTFTNELDQGAKDPRDKSKSMVNTDSVSRFFGKVPNFDDDKHTVDTKHARTLFIYGLNDNIDEEYLVKSFKCYGAIILAKIFRHSTSNQHLRCGLVKYSQSTSAENALSKTAQQLVLMGAIVNAKLELNGEESSEYVRKVESQLNNGLCFSIKDNLIPINSIEPEKKKEVVDCSNIIEEQLPPLPEYEAPALPSEIPPVPPVVIAPHSLIIVSALNPAMNVMDLFMMLKNLFYPFGCLNVGKDANGRWKIDFYTNQGLANAFRAIHNTYAMGMHFLLQATLQLPTHPQLPTVIANNPTPLKESQSNATNMLKSYIYKSSSNTTTTDNETSHKSIIPHAFKHIMQEIILSIVNEIERKSVLKPIMEEFNKWYALASNHAKFKHNVLKPNQRHKDINYDPFTDHISQGLNDIKIKRLTFGKPSSLLFDSNDEDSDIEISIRPRIKRARKNNALFRNQLRNNNQARSKIKPGRSLSINNNKKGLNKANKSSLSEDEDVYNSSDTMDTASAADDYESESDEISNIDYSLEPKQKLKKGSSNKKTTVGPSSLDNMGESISTAKTDPFIIPQEFDLLLHNDHFDDSTVAAKITAILNYINDTIILNPASKLDCILIIDQIRAADRPTSDTNKLILFYLTLKPVLLRLIYEYNNPVQNRKHKEGSARTVGYYKISQDEKKEYLACKASLSAPSFSSIDQATNQKIKDFQRRMVRATARQMLQQAPQSDLQALNNLQNRKKQLRFGPSAIHDVGLFALEMVNAGDMVIEYVGEVISIEMADQRELDYTNEGIGSSYLFRVDDKDVIDSTKKGNIARFINHSCDPNCIAKVLSVGGESHIVIYSRKNISLGEEITYDYKFPFEEEDKKIPCNCKSAACRKYLNYQDV